MNTVQITSLEQVPAGLTMLFERMSQLEDLIQNQANQPIPATDPAELLTRQQAADRLQISLPTLNELTKSGKLVGYRMGRSLRYKANEITGALTLIKTNSLV